jgi:uncharacterized protein (TIGR01777 family)
MKVRLAGGSGQVGQILTRAFLESGDEVVHLSRNPDSCTPGVRTVVWDGVHRGAWWEALEGSDVVIDLAGRSVNCRYHAKNRAEIFASRVESVQAIGEAIRSVSNPPAIWLQASTATIYQHTHGRPNDEASGLLGGSEVGVPETWRFSVDVAKAWEAAVGAVGPLKRTRTVLLRSAMTMSPDAGGVFDVLLRLVRFGLGGPSGDGKQFVSWIHDRDFVRAVKEIIRKDQFRGPVNLSSPNPLPNWEFMKVLRKAWGIPFGLPAPGLLLEVGTFLLRTESELVLKSRRVVPGKMRDAGFIFEFPEWASATKDLCERWRLCECRR